MEDPLKAYLDLTFAKIKKMNIFESLLTAFEGVDTLRGPLDRRQMGFSSKLSLSKFSTTNLYIFLHCSWNKVLIFLAFWKESFHISAGVLTYGYRYRRDKRLTVKSITDHHHRKRRAVVLNRCAGFCSSAPTNINLP